MLAAGRTTWLRRVAVMPLDDDDPDRARSVRSSRIRSPSPEGSLTMARKSDAEKRLTPAVLHDLCLALAGGGDATATRSQAGGGSPSFSGGELQARAGHRFYRSLSDLLALWLGRSRRARPSRLHRRSAHPYRLSRRGRASAAAWRWRVSRPWSRRRARANVPGGRRAMQSARSDCSESAPPPRAHGLPRASAQRCSTPAAARPRGGAARARLVRRPACGRSVRSPRRLAQRAAPAARVSRHPCARNDALCSLPFALLAASERAGL